MKIAQWLRANCRFAQGAPAANPRAVLEEFGLSADMNFLLDPSGNEVPCPGMSHVGEAQKIVAKRGQQVDPDLALETLIKEGWVRISGNVFELVPTPGWKERVRAFIARHKDFYANEPVLEIDNRAKGYSRQVPTSSLYQGYDIDSPAAQRADELRRWR